MGCSRRWVLAPGARNGGVGRSSGLARRDVFIFLKYLEAADGGQAGLGQGGGWVGQQAIGWMERDETSYA